MTFSPLFKKNTVLLLLGLMTSLGTLAQDMKIEVSGWYNDGWIKQSHKSYLKNHTRFSQVNPYWYNLGTTDDYNEDIDGSIYKRTYAFNSSHIDDVHERGDLVLPAIGDVSRFQMNKIINNPEASNALIQNLVNEAVKHNFDGWDINFEKAYANTKDAKALFGDPKKQQQLFTDFVESLAAKLHEEEKRLSVTIKAAENAQMEAIEIFDYSALGQTSADYFKVMVYDNHYNSAPDWGASPSPIQGLPWVENCINYLLENGIPKEKFTLAVGLHGYEWPNDGSKSACKETNYADVMARNPTKIHWNAGAQETYMDYVKNETPYRVYIGDFKTVKLRLELIKKYELAGVAFWSLGKEDMLIYKGLNDLF